jgi:hypothetical protein
LTNNIHCHDFNSKWWGSPVGITWNPECLSSSSQEWKAEAESFSWVEARVPASMVPTQAERVSNGFFWADLQLEYRVSLRKIQSLPGSWSVIDAAERQIDPKDFASFAGERYRSIPGITNEILQARYEMWARSLVRNSPSSCATVFDGREVAGYVFGTMDGLRANFSLAVASRRSTSHGLGVYLGAAELFRRCGAKSMHASLSAANTSALNSHVILGCTFVNATTIWLRCSDSLGSN